MLAKILLPLLWPIAAALVQYLKAKHRWMWAPAGIFGQSEASDPHCEKESRRLALKAILSSTQMTYLIYVAAWSQELIKLWHRHPILTAFAVILVAGMVDFTPRSQMTVQN